MRFCRHPPHQDLYYMPIRPANRIVAAWTAMEPCDSENGCLYVAPESHRADRLYEHSYPLNSDGTINKFYHGIKVRYLLLFITLYINLTVSLNDDFLFYVTKELPSIKEWVNLEMQTGDTVFFHPLLIHGSGVNKSKRTRRAISCHYSTADCNVLDVRK